MQQRRRLPQILLNAATAMSLALSVATAVLWVRSYRAADRLYRVRAAGAQYFGVDSVAARRGRLIFQSGRLDEPAGYPDGAGPSRLRYQSVPLRGVEDPDTARGVATWAGFGWGRYPYSVGLGPSGYSLGLGPSGTMRVAVVPLYCVALVLAAPAIVRARKRLKGRRAARRAGRCPTCGSDLRATPGGCPECGGVPPPAPNTPARAFPT